MKVTVFTDEGDIARKGARRLDTVHPYCCVTLGDVDIHVSGEKGAMAAYKLSERLRAAADEVLEMAALDKVSA